MKFCSHCGSELADDAVICPNCGSAEVQQPAPAHDDKRSVILNIVGFLFPIVGLILYLCLKKDTPVRAKSIGKWTLTGFIIGVVLSIIFGILAVKFGMDFMKDYLDDPSASTQLTDSSATGTRAFEAAGDGVTETLTFSFTNDLISALTDDICYDITGAAEADVADLKSQYDDIYAQINEIDGCTYEFTTDGNQAVIKIELTGLDSADTLDAVAATGYLDSGSETGMLYMSAQADGLLGSGWTEIT